MTPSHFRRSCLTCKYKGEIISHLLESPTTSQARELQFVLLPLVCCIPTELYSIALPLSFFPPRKTNGFIFLYFPFPQILYLLGFVFCFHSSLPSHAWTLACTPLAQAKPRSQGHVSFPPTTLLTHWWCSPLLSNAGLSSMGHNTRALKCQGKDT